MSRAAMSVFVMGLYILVVGALMLLVPDLLLAPFGIDTGNGLWVRVSGMLIIFLSVYYITSARKEQSHFFRMTVYVRVFPLIFFSAFVLFGFADWPLAFFGVVDILSGAWTARELRAEWANISAG